jgi:hypothetical protein
MVLPSLFVLKILNSPESYIVYLLYPLSVFPIVPLTLSVFKVCEPDRTYYYLVTNNDKMLDPLFDTSKISGYFIFFMLIVNPFIWNSIFNYLE